MTHGSLFSGIGGFDLAAEWMQWENVFHCEWNKFGQSVLKHYWPQSISYEDITKTDFTIHRGRIDVLTGGFPCQPYSTAGKRKGKDDERHLWPEMLRAIREIQPRWVVGENVRGLVNWNGGMVFDEVQADLEAQGYEVQPFILPACGVNAPHRRDRVWFVAYSDKNGDLRRPEEVSSESGEEWVQKRESIQQSNEPSSLRGDAADADDEKRDGRCGSSEQEREKGEQRRHGIFSTASRFSQERDASDAEVSGSEREYIERQRKGELRGCDCEEFAPDAMRTRGRQDNGQGKPRQFDETSKTTNWQIFPTESPICGGDDGLPRQLDGITFPKWRNESIMAYGNAIVPQVVYQIFQAIQTYDHTRTKTNH
jgi:DNA (cytosine-5)-methyltransferase 1